MANTEVKWSCGCFEEDGKLVVECTQTAPQGEVSAGQHAVNKPFSAKCARKAHAAGVNAVQVLTAAAFLEPGPPTE